MNHDWAEMPVHERDDLAWLFLALRATGNHDSPGLGALGVKGAIYSQVEALPGMRCSSLRSLR